ncbi:MAG: AzlD domain-containing protein [Lachnospiraceae bacterium]|nr:AzlD domain-containing protein [Candidatus Merdinaster equi]
MSNELYILLCILIMILTTNAIRILPIPLIRGKIQNKFIRSFLFYVPYVTLAVMTFPAIMEATQVPIAGIAALLAGIIASYFGLGLFPVAIICCALVFGIEWFMIP